MVTVEAGGSLCSLIPPQTAVSNAETVGEALQQLRLPADVALIIMVNGRLAHWTTRLHDGDVVQLLPTIGGGTI